MPTYEYECTRCNRRFEEFQSISAKPLKRIKTDCDQCNHNAPVRRLIGTGAAVLFKGNGFYQTDYRSEAYRKSAKAEKTDGTKSDTSGGNGSEKKSSDSKPAGDGGTKKGDS